VKDVLKYGALAAAAYMVYRYVSQSASAASADPATTTTQQTATQTTTIGPAATQPATTQQPAAVTQPTQAQVTTRGLLLAASSGDPAIVSGTANYHVWGFYYNQVRGVPAPAPENVAMGDGMRRITVDEFLAAIATAGMSGLRGNFVRR
jgi:hypothetical protein